MDDGYKHYIRTDANGVVIKGYTSGFLKESGGDEEILPGDLILPDYDSRQFQLQLTNDRLQFRYKLVSGDMTLKTQAELDAEWASKPPAPPSTEDRLAAAEAALVSIMGL